MTEKDDIRAVMRSRRRDLKRAWIERRSEELAMVLFEMDEFRRAQSVACYLSGSGEVSTDAIIRKCLEKGSALCVPAFRRESGSYCLCWLKEGTTLSRGPMAISQPADPMWVENVLLDVMLVPGMAFDVQGGRVGHGGGHYDRLMAGTSCHRAFKIGLA